MVRFLDACPCSPRACVWAAEERGSGRDQAGQGADGFDAILPKHERLPPAKHEGRRFREKSDIADAFRTRDASVLGLASSFSFAEKWVPPPGGNPDEHRPIGLLTPGCKPRSRLPTPAGAVAFGSSSPVTVAQPSPICTGFPSHWPVKSLSAGSAEPALLSKSAAIPKALPGHCQGPYRTRVLLRPCCKQPSPAEPPLAPPHDRTAQADRRAFGSGQSLRANGCIPCGNQSPERKTAGPTSRIRRRWLRRFVGGGQAVLNCLPRKKDPPCPRAVVPIPMNHHTGSPGGGFQTLAGKMAKIHSSASTGPYSGTSR
ncbi:MAG: hypothetical protein KatS3mg132_814 [Limisphaera sp.]|nr:MAG: hypothetical protein KatS3mg132_814 [Limisphaera sp.]